MHLERVLSNQPVEISLDSKQVRPRRDLPRPRAAPALARAALPPPASPPAPPLPSLDVISPRSPPQVQVRPYAVSKGGALERIIEER